MGKELTVGHVLKEKYEIVSKYGAGSLGDDVYIGKHRELEREILIRVLPPSMTSDSELSQRFIQGVRLTASLQHPNILPAYDAGDEDGNFYFVTGFEKGFFLDQYIEQRGKLEEKEAVNIIIALADALKEAWESKKIIHRNICPKTILLAKGNHPMLTDFGLAKSQESSGKALTMTGFTVGNPQYMSPEQVNAEKELDFHADMYCLGLVFYEMLAGHPAFQDKSQVALMDAQATKQPASLKTENSKVSERCIKVMNQMIEKDRNKRFSSWKDLIKGLNSLLEEEKPKKVPQKPASDEADKKLKEFIKIVAAEKKRKLKRNITIIFIIANIIVVLIAVKYVMDKNKKADENPKDAPEAINFP
ncbi:MAG TPA: hypothetical protein DCZ94_17115 [Lentisphaeria bacterium]|nr:MAG: hypothetical protein A2X48_21065 [Lentisphaerae bacterium GWF2_49_21]HBC88667.1 hypothetical protein [Lentisphaeria bacterium]